MFRCELQLWVLCVLSPELGRIRPLGMGLCPPPLFGAVLSLPLGLVQVGFGPCCAGMTLHFSGIQPVGVSSAIRQPQHQPPGEMRCRDVSVAAPGALVHVGGEAAGL